MTAESIDLCGRVCPYPVVEVIREADRLHPGEALRCLVDDPLAIKSIPEELEDYDDISITITPVANGWDIVIERQ